MDDGCTSVPAEDRLLQNFSRVFFALGLIAQIFWLLEAVYRTSFERLTTTFDSFLFLSVVTAGALFVFGAIVSLIGLGTLRTRVRMRALPESLVFLLVGLTYVELLREIFSGGGPIRDLVYGLSRYIVAPP